mgnify:FL=1
MSFTNCEAQDLNHVTVFRMRGSEISAHSYALPLSMSHVEANIALK